MSKKIPSRIEDTYLHVGIRPSRHLPLSNFEEPDQKIETEPGQSQSVLKLYQDFVLGRLDPSQIGGTPQYDSAADVITEDIDPFNSFGMTLEQADALRQANEQTIRSEKRNRKDVANASNGTKQDEPQPKGDVMTAKDQPQVDPTKE